MRGIRAALAEAVVFRVASQRAESAAVVLNLSLRLDRRVREVLNTCGSLSVQFYCIQYMRFQCVSRARGHVRADVSRAAGKDDKWKKWMGLGDGKDEKWTRPLFIFTVSSAHTTTSTFHLYRRPVSAPQAWGNGVDGLGDDDGSSGHCTFHLQ